MPATLSKDTARALEQRYGKQGVEYLEHLRTSTSNPVLKRAVEELEREAENPKGPGADAPARKAG